MGSKKSKEWYDKELKGIGMAVFNTGVHEKRGSALAELIAKDSPKKIFEFAAGGSILAQKVISLLPQAAYFWSDFSDTAIEDARKNLVLPNFSIWSIDIDSFYPKIEWANFDAIVCVSMEHLAHDREILEAVPLGKKVFLSIPNIDAPDHIRVLNKTDDIYARYGDIIKIESITPCTKLFKLVVGTRY